MRFLFIIIIGLFFGLMLAILLATHTLFHNPCGATLQLRLDTPWSLDAKLYDYTTGVHYEQALSLLQVSSPDGKYHYEISQTMTKNREVFVIDHQNGERRSVYVSSIINEVIWSYDSRAVLIWEFNDKLEISLVTSIDIRSGEQRFSHEFAPETRRQRFASQDNRYVFAQFPLDMLQMRQGVFFVDTIGGDITRFDHATDFPYLWSENLQWVASQYQGMISIIDPTTGDFHPQFPEPIAGRNFVWHGNDLWFTRHEPTGDSVVWQANLSTGQVERRIDQASILLLSDNGQWAYIYNLHDADWDMALYDLISQQRYPLNIDRTKHEDIVMFSPNSRCVAIFLSSYARGDGHELSIVDLETLRIRHQETLHGDINDIRWYR